MTVLAILLFMAALSDHNAGLFVLACIVWSLRRKDDDDR